MPFVRSNYESGFTRIDNRVFQDKRLKQSDIGLYCFICSLPDTWEFSEKGLQRASGFGITSIRSSLMRLEAAGYIDRMQQARRGKDGTFCPGVWTFYELPHRVRFSNTVNDESPDDNHISKPDTDSSHRVRFSDHGNRTLYKTDYIKLGTEENTVSQVDSSLQPVSPSLVDVQPEKSYQVVTGSWTKVEFELCGYCGASEIYSNGSGFACRSCGRNFRTKEEMYGASPPAW